jgi:hypothetical protein
VEFLLIQRNVYKSTNIFLNLNMIYFLCSSIEIKSYNRLERKNTYNVIGIMKGEIEPGIINFVTGVRDELFLSFKIVMLSLVTIGKTIIQ